MIHGNNLDIVQSKCRQLILTVTDLCFVCSTSLPEALETSQVKYPSKSRLTIFCSAHSCPSQAVLGDDITMQSLNCPKRRVLSSSLTPILSRSIFLSHPAPSILFSESSPSSRPSLSFRLLFYHCKRLMTAFQGPRSLCF